jgi:O-antigen biosynthesis protein WbqP
VALIALVALSPLFLVLCAAIKIESQGPVIFAQKRVGKNYGHFIIYKFRTMRADAPRDVPTHLLRSPGRFYTRVGKFLRRFSLDELPQLVNIIAGDMSFVGPRPALWNQYDLAKLRDTYECTDIRPGLTGWAQVNGRDELPLDVKARYDGEYRRKMSLAFDVKIMFMTLVKAIRADGMAIDRKMGVENGEEQTTKHTRSPKEQRR